MNARDVPQPLQGLLISVMALATLLGGFILAANDLNLAPIGSLDLSGTWVTVVSRTPTPALPPRGTSVGTQVTPPDFATPTALTPTPAATASSTPTPTPICPAPPANWIRIDYSQAETPLPIIVLRYNTTFERLFEVNCLDKVPLQARPWLYVPALSPVLSPTAPTPVLNCLAPPGWPVYRVQWGDTLSNLAARFNISVVMLMRYNCLNSSLIYQGQLLHVPYALPAPLPTGMPMPWPTDTPTPAQLQTDTPTPWSIVIPTDTPTSWSIVIPTDTPTPTPWLAVIPTDTPTPWLTVTPTDTPMPTPTDTPMPTPTDTPTPMPTVDVPTDTPTSTPTPPVLSRVTPGLP